MALRSSLSPLRRAMPSRCAVSSVKSPKRHRACLFLPDPPSSDTGPRLVRRLASRHEPGPASRAVCTTETPIQTLLPRMYTNRSKDQRIKRARGQKGGHASPLNVHNVHYSRDACQHEESAAPGRYPEARVNQPLTRPVVVSINTSLGHGRMNAPTRQRANTRRPMPRLAH